jgi:GNAT superfamily N-acetyltransferase
MNDKLQQLYDLYKQKGIINTTDFNTFAAANDAQRQKLYDLGVQKGLFNTTDYNTFNTAWGGGKQEPLKKKEPTVSESKSEKPSSVSSSRRFEGVTEQPISQKKVRTDDYIDQVQNAKKQPKQTKTVVANTFVPNATEQTVDVITTDEANQMMADDFGKKEFKLYSQISEIDPSVLQQGETASVEYLNNKFKGSGFVFEETGLGNSVRIKSTLNDGFGTVINEKVVQLPTGLFPGMTDAKGAAAGNAQKEIADFMQQAFLKKSEKEFLNEEVKDYGQLVKLAVNNPQKYGEGFLNEYDSERWLDKQYRELVIEGQSIKKEQQALENEIKSYQLSGIKSEETERDIRSRQANLQNQVQANTAKYKELQDISTKLPKAAAVYFQNKEKEGNTLGLITRNLASGLMNIEKSLITTATDVAPLLIPSEYLIPEVQQVRLKASGMTEADIRDYAAKQLRKGVVDEALEGAKDLYSLGTTEAYAQSEDRNDLEKTASFLAESIGTAISGGGNPLLSKVAFFSQSYNAIEDEMNSAQFDEMSQMEKKIMSVPYGLVIGALDKLGFNVATKIGSNPVVNKLITNTIANAFASIPKNASLEVMEQAIKESLTATIAKTGLQIVGGSLVEGATEGTQSLAEYTMKNLYNNVVADKDVFQDVPDITTKEGFEKALGAAKEEFYYGALGGMIMSSGGVALESIVKGFDKGAEEFDFFSKVIDDPNLRALIETDIKTKITSGELTKAQAAEQIDAINKSVSILNQMPADMSSDKKMEAYNLILEKNKIDKEIDGKDPNLVKPQTERVGEINNRLQEIAQENAVQKQSANAIPVQPKTGVSEEVEGGTPETGLKEVTEKATQEIDNYIADIGSEERIGSTLNPLMDKMANAEYINDNDIDNAINSIFSEVERIESSDQFSPETKAAMSDKLLNIADKLDNYEFRTKTENVEVAKAGAASPTRKTSAAVQKIRAEKYFNAVQATVNGQEVTLQDENGRVEAPMPNGEVIVLDTPSMEIVEDGFEFDENDALVSVTVNDRLGNTVKLTGDQALDFAIRDRENKIGVVEQAEFDKAYQEIETQYVKEAKPAEEPVVEEVVAEEAPVEEPAVEEVVAEEKITVTNPNQRFEFTDETLPAELQGVEPVFMSEVVTGKGKNRKVRRNMKFTGQQMVDAGLATSAQADAKTKQLNALLNVEVATDFSEVNPNTKKTNKVLDQVTNAAKAISKVLPKVKFVVHATPEAFVKATSAIEGRKTDAGLYDHKTKTIHINLQSANNVVVAHEVFHALILSKVGSDAEATRLTRAMVKAVIKSLKSAKGSAKIIEFLEDFEKEYDANVQNEEKLAELFAILADNYKQLPLDTRNVIVRFLERIAKLFGIKPMTSAEVIEFMNVLSRKVEGGDVITFEEVGKQKEGEVSAARKQIIGEKGAERLDVMEGNTRRMSNLVMAKNMTDDGKSPLEIRVATGWELGADGKWRYETVDNIPYLKDTVNKVNKYLAENKDANDAYQKAEFFLPPELIKMYPELKDITIEFGRGNEKEGSYSPLLKLIRVNVGVYPKNTVSVLLHEVQHVIQEIEGFDSGASMDRLMTKFVDREKGLSYRIKRLKGRGGNEALLEKAINDYREFVANFAIENNGKKILNAFNLYNRKSGEVEARNVQERMNMTEEERRNTLLSETAEVKKPQQIFSENMFQPRKRKGGIKTTIDEFDGETTVTLDGNKIGKMFYDRSIKSWVNAEFDRSSVKPSTYKWVYGDILGENKAEAIDELIRRNEESKTKQEEAKPKDVTQYTDDQIVNEFLTALNDKGSVQRNPIGREFIYGDKAFLELSRFDKETGAREISIQSIASMDKGQGIGKAVMKDITDTADELGMTLTLDAKPFGDQGLSKEALIKFYEKNGFVPDLEEAFGGEFETEEELIDYVLENEREALPMVRTPKREFAVRKRKTKQDVNQEFENSAFFFGGFFTGIQNQGIGKSIIYDIFKNNPKLENILLYTQEDAIGFWKKVGGEVIKEGYDKNGINRYYVKINRDSVPESKNIKELGVSYKNKDTKNSKIDKGEYSINYGKQKIGFFFVNDLGTIKTDPQNIIEEQEFSIRKKKNSVDRLVKEGKKQGKTDQEIKDDAKAAGFTFREASTALSNYYAKEEGVFVRSGKTGVTTKLYEGAKRWKERNLKSKGLLPKIGFFLKEKMEGEISKETNRAVKIARKFGKMFDNYKGDKNLLLDAFDRFLRGDTTVSLPNNFASIANEMRNHIDTLSKMLINVGAVEAELADVIRGNIGSYLTRSYEIYDNKNWRNNVGKETITKAKNFLRSQESMLEMAVDKATQENITLDEALDILVDNKIDDLFAQTEPSSLVSGSRLGSKDLSTLKEREEIPEEIRMLMGEYSDPAMNYARTVNSIIHLAARHKFLTDMRKAGLGKFFYEKNDLSRPVGFNSLISAEGSEVMAPLNGLYTTPEIVEAFNQEFGQKEISDALKVLYTAMGAVKWLKTIASVGTHAKNIVSNLGFVMVNGHNITKLYDAYKIIKEDLKTMSDAQIQAKIDEYVEAGIMRQGAGINEIRDMFKDTNLDKYLERRLSNKKSKGLLGKVKSGLINFKTKAEALYQAEDDMFKIAAYENEISRYSDAYYNKKYDKLTPQEKAEVSKVASENVKNTYPTYSRIPAGIKKLRRFPLFIGSFISFQAESYRTAYNTIALAKEELASDNKKIKMIGATRIAGATAYLTIKNALLSYYGMAFGTGLSGIIGALFNDDEEEKKEKDAIEFLPPWSKNSDIIFKKNTDGVIEYIDFSSSDPHGGINKALNAFFRGENLTESFTNSFLGVVEQFTGPDITLDLALQLKNNTDKFGNQIYNTQAPFDEQAKTIIDYVYKTIEPGTATSIRKFVGDEDKTNVIVGELTGAKTRKIDVIQQFGFKLNDLKKELDDIKSPYNSEYYKAVRMMNDPKVSKKEFDEQARKTEQAYATANALYDAKTKEIMNLLNSANKLGADYDALMQEVQSRKVISQYNLFEMEQGRPAMIEEKQY